MTFQPIFKERPWGGHSLARLYGKELPDDKLIGESWEITDRDGAVSVIRNGVLAGKSLRWLLETHSEAVLGEATPAQKRFPLLIKIIDAEGALSLQVHPPEQVAAELGGTPKTEIWYVAEAREGAEILAGLKRGTTHTEFEARIKSGSLIECIHRVPIAAGSAMLVPGGRVHAICGQVVLFEIQQNSDTTYRVFDWNRVDKEGNGRELHIESALRCIDFEDYEPSLLPQSASASMALADERAFRVEVADITGTHEIAAEGSFLIVGGVAGRFVVESERERLDCAAGMFCLVPACLPAVRLASEGPARLLLIRAGRHPS